MQEASRPLLLLSIGRTMSLLFLLPLLFAHRPINVQPRASILRRMPIFYGKRDPSLSSPVSLILSDAASYQRLAESGRRNLPQAYDESTDSIGFRTTSTRTRAENRLKNWETPKKPFPNDANALRDVSGNRSPWTVSSVLFQKLQDYIRSDANRDRFTVPFFYHQERKRQGYRARPQFYDSQLWKRRDEHGHKIGTDNLYEIEAAVADADDVQEERLRNRLETIVEAGSYYGDHGKNTPIALVQEEKAHVIPLDWKSVKHNLKKKYVLYTFDDMLGGITTDDDGDDDGNDADATTIRRLYSAQSQRQNTT